MFNVVYSVPAQQPQAFVANTATVEQSQNWYVDSSASHHIAANPQNLVNGAPHNNQEHICLGSGQGLLIKPIGSASHPPSITKNLITVGQFVKDNCINFEFHPYNYAIIPHKDHKVLLQGILHQMDFIPFPICSQIL